MKVVLDKIKSSRLYKILIAVLFLVTFLMAIFLFFDSERKEESFKSSDDFQSDRSMRSATVYLPDESKDKLVKVDIGQVAKSFKEDLARELLLKVIGSDQFSSNVSAVFYPEDIFFFDNLVVLNFGSDIRDKFRGSIQDEFLFLESMKSTLMANFENVEKLRILIDDKASDIFISHIDISNDI